MSQKTALLLKNTVLKFPVHHIFELTEAKGCLPISFHKCTTTSQMWILNHALVPGNAYMEKYLK